MKVFGQGNMGTIHDLKIICSEVMSILFSIWENYMAPHNSNFIRASFSGKHYIRLYILLINLCLFELLKNLNRVPCIQNLKELEAFHLER